MSIIEKKSWVLEDALCTTPPQVIKHSRDLYEYFEDFREDLIDFMSNELPDLTENKLADMLDSGYVLTFTVSIPKRDLSAVIDSWTLTDE